jgi:DNA-binding transcriptional ArsR family regulator
MWELVRSLQALRDPASAALHLPWLRTLSGRLGDLDLRPAVALVPPRGFSPDFLTPPPSSPLGDVAEDLAALRATTAAQVRRDMEFFDRSHGNTAAITAPWVAHPRRNVTRLADTLAEYWARAIEPSWPRIRALLDADLAHRSRRLTEGGIARLFADLHPLVRWRGDQLEVDIAFTDTVELGGRGLLLMPSAFMWSRPGAISEPPWQPTVIYPARGIATLWEEGDRAPAGLARVIGEARARLLQQLDAPRSTTELARRTGLTPGGASQHLTALRGAGLVTGRREGRLVLYVRTPLADALVAA